MLPASIRVSKKRQSRFTGFIRWLFDGSQRELEHQSTGQMLRVKGRMTAVELAVLVQNKIYELPANGLEQIILTRGGPDGDPKDELDRVTTLERVRALAHGRKWLYFEVKNVIMHHSHTPTYRKLGGDMFAGSLDEVDHDIEDICYSYS
ncbi:hypothetical protein N8T08_008110 [Aspergillus melleus]|uniref:Uncharacterized protein n=1 Tax=Aspergillus melleus TaxID=138277 RepID=A0ACC3AWL2_9EURO|nr:hypothetical protein N8T08_008110 [Aspergillus melleus]